MSNTFDGKPCGPFVHLASIVESDVWASANLTDSQRQAWQLRTIMVQASPHHPRWRAGGPKAWSIVRVDTPVRFRPN